MKTAFVEESPTILVFCTAGVLALVSWTDLINLKCDNSRIFLIRHSNLS